MSEYKRRNKVFGPMGPLNLTPSQMWHMKFKPQRVGWREMTVQEVVGRFTITDYIRFHGVEPNRVIVPDMPQREHLFE